MILYSLHPLQNTDLKKLYFTWEVALVGENIGGVEKDTQNNNIKSKIKKLVNLVTFWKDRKSSSKS